MDIKVKTQGEKKRLMIYSKQNNACDVNLRKMSDEKRGRGGGVRASGKIHSRFNRSAELFLLAGVRGTGNGEKKRIGWNRFISSKEDENNKHLRCKTQLLLTK